ncbi:HI0074 family nucleotidyltransferase substrate-binding subunit [Candidatus Margulisiibacteriota bacterium]
MKRFSQIKEDFSNALQRLDEAVLEAESILEIDGVIQRFEFTFELFWKLLKVYLEKEGIIAKTPRSCLKEAYKISLIKDEELWLKMLEDRNYSVHIYDQNESREIYERIKGKYVNAFRDAFSIIN